MNIQAYRIANTVFAIDSIYSNVHELCREYKCSAPIEFIIKTNQSDIDYEREKSKQKDIKEGNLIRNFSDGYLETIAVYRKLCEKIIDNEILLFHGSAIAVDGTAYLFTAKSGTGKSTHTRLWREHFGSRAVMINDDKPLIKIGEDGVRIYGTPWDGKHRISTNTSAPLKAIILLNRGNENKITEINKNTAYPILLQQTHKPSDKMSAVFKLIDILCENVKFYRLECNMDPASVMTAYNGMNTEE